jgi:hypothetical protein
LSSGSFVILAKLRSIDLLFIILDFVLLNPECKSAAHKRTRTYYSEIIFIDSFNLFIAFDYLPIWRQHPPHNELPYALWLFRVLAGVQPGDRSVSVAMRCRPST